ncbi:MAG: MFS transporter [Bryobacteraceae bacterium]|nr:MFS transporter [Bryobacteraceae bacterium]
MTQPTPAPHTHPVPIGQQPTRTRYWVVVFAITLAILSYIDRVCISQAATPIMRDLNLTRTQMGQIFSSFAIAYALFEVPGGWLGDRIGARKVLMRIVIWWSAFTAITGYMWSYWSMYIARFLFGAGEAGCFPNLTKAFSAWLPNHERTRAQGIMWMFARWGGAFTPPLVILVFNYMSWRTAFVLFGALGAFWAVAFYFWYRDNPRDHKDVNQAELALLAGNERLATGHGDVPWGKLLKSRTIWLLWAQYFFITYPWYFYITWLPVFLKERYPLLTDSERANLAVLPLFFGGIGSVFSGFFAARVTTWTGSTKATRRILACTGFFGATAMLLVFIQFQGTGRGATMDAALMSMAFLALTSFFNDLVMPGAWATCMDVGGKYAGTVSGSMNMMGNLAGFVAPTVGGLIVDAKLGWSTFLYTMAVMYFLGGLCWPFIDPTKPLDPEDAVDHP